MKLHERLTEWYYTHNAVQSGDVIANEIVDVVKEWLKTHHREDDNKYDLDYYSGWMDCIETLEKNAR
jgi:hemerythrin